MKAPGSAEVRASSCAVSWSVPGARPRPRSIRSPWNCTRVPNCSITASGEWFGSMIPPEPTRIRCVIEAARSISSEVAEEARESVLWCSANQYRS